MLKRLIISAAIAVCASAVPSVLMAATPSPAPTPTAAATISGALLDTITKSTTQTTTLKQQGLLGYDITFHNDTYQYALPLCADVSLVEVNGNNINPVSLVSGDTLVVSVRPNSAAPAKACVSRIVRDKIGRGASGGECLQDFQVKHTIDGQPERLFIKKEYQYQIIAYSRPTLDCDGKAYGSNPITTVVAAGKPFLITLTRAYASGTNELLRWTLTTDKDGHASFSYTFADPSDSYRFNVSPGGNDTPGDVISWDAKVLDPNPSPSPLPTSAASSGFSPLPLIILIIFIAIGAGAAEYWHRVRYFRRQGETPEQEYQRSEKIKWHD
jgi:hypothetical protein